MFFFGRGENKRHLSGIAPQMRLSRTQLPKEWNVGPIIATENTTSAQKVAKEGKSPAISGKFRLVKYYNLVRFMINFERNSPGSEELRGLDD